MLLKIYTCNETFSFAKVPIIAKQLYKWKDFKRHRLTHNYIVMDKETSVIDVTDILITRIVTDNIIPKYTRFLKFHAISKIFILMTFTHIS